MATAADFAAMQGYRRLMEEAKARVLSVDTLMHNVGLIPSAQAQEYGYLQLRMVCEVISLGCLVAHGDLVAKGPKALRNKTYKPDEIIEALELLHADFYPVPCIPQVSPSGLHLADYDKPYLTKTELPKLWGLCGNVLHRGTLKNLERAPQASELAFRDISVWAQKVLNLLSVHRIVNATGKLTYITFLEDSDRGGNVTVVLGEAP